MPRHKNEVIDRFESANYKSYIESLQYNLN